MANAFLEGLTKPLEEGDTAINFEAVNQNYRKITLNDLVSQGPILLFSSWSRASGLRDQYFEAFKQYESILTSKGHRIVFIGAENYAMWKEDQEKYGLQNCIFIDDVSQNRFQISNSFFGDTPNRIKNYCCAIDPNMLIKYKQYYPETYNFEFFFKIVSEYIQEAY